MKEINQRYIDVVSESMPIIINTFQDILNIKSLGRITNITYETSTQKDRQHPIVKLTFADTPAFPESKIHRAVLYPIDISPTMVSTNYLSNEIYDLFLQWPIYPSGLGESSIVSLLNLQTIQQGCMHLINCFIMVMDYLKIKKIELECRESNALYITIHTLEKNTEGNKIYFSNCITIIKELNKIKERVNENSPENKDQ